MSCFKVICKVCESDDVTVTPVKFSNDTLHINGKCNKCLTSDKLAQNAAPELFVMPFGKYKGSTLSEILNSDENYVKWFIAEEGMSRSIAKKFSSLYENRK